MVLSETWQVPQGFHLVFSHSNSPKATSSLSVLSLIRKELRDKCRHAFVKAPFPEVENDSTATATAAGSNWVKYFNFLMQELKKQINRTKENGTMVLGVD